MKHASFARSVLLGLHLTLAASLAAIGQTNIEEPIDQEAIASLRKHGLEQSRVMDHLSWICDVHGPRLTGSANLRRAQNWAVERLTSFGLANAGMQAWGPFGNGWQLDHFSMHVVGDNPWPVLAWPKAWSPPTGGEIEAEFVFVAKMSPDEVAAADLTGKIVMLESIRDVDEPFEAEARRYDAPELLTMANGTRQDARGRRPRRSAERPAGAPARNDASGVSEFQRRGQMLRAVWAKKPAAIVDRGSKGDYGTIFVSSASVPQAEGGGRTRVQDASPSEIIPQCTLSVEHYNRIVRLLEKGIPVRARYRIDSTYLLDDPMEYNVTAEMPGTDPVIGNEVVMIGAHYDSWHSATGATDNGCGSAVMMEAMRLIGEMCKETGRKPRRTIRIALWSGEEQGLLGSRAWVAQNLAVPGERGQPPASLLPAHETFAGYFNLDNGTGRVRGIYLQENAAVAPIFRAWLRPFHDLEASTLDFGTTGGTDHLAFDAVGLPGFQFIQDPVSYSPRTHHSNMDNWDHAVATDLQQAATIVASFAWHAAQRDEKLPRK